MPNGSMPPLDRSNVQGLILRGYTHPYSCHMLFTFAGRPGAAKFIGALLPFVQSAEDWGNVKPERMLNIGLAAKGFFTFYPTLKGQFPYEFEQGPWNAQSQSSLQDTGASDPSLWWNGYDKGAIHCVVHVYALNAAALAGLVTIVSQAAHANGVKEFLPLQTGNGRLEEYTPLGDFIHFGYHDGIDNPAMGWPDDPAKTATGDANNFLIGYPGSAFSPGPATGPAAPVAKDGCYNAFRILYQDVGTFDKFLTTNAPAVVAAIGGTVEQAKAWLAAKLVGRWFNDSPLILSPAAPDPATADATAFGYGGDTNGVRCPFSAHTRNANPRDEGVFTADQPVPRIPRRGMPYGAPAVPPDYGGERGLIGLFLSGWLAGQFELVYSWMNLDSFSAVFPDPTTQDAVLANRGTPPAVNPSFTIPLGNGATSLVIPTLPQFLITRGTAYCLLPSIKTLRGIAAMAG